MSIGNNNNNVNSANTLTLTPMIGRRSTLGMRDILAKIAKDTNQGFLKGE